MAVSALLSGRELGGFRIGSSRVLVTWGVGGFCAYVVESLEKNVSAQVRAELTKFIVTNYLFGDVARAPRDNDSLVEGGIIDSTGILELIEFLESQFGIGVSDEETIPDNLGSIDNLVAFVMAKRAVREPSL
jgi:acyl carrier protein